MAASPRPQPAPQEEYPSVQHTSSSTASQPVAGHTPPKKKIPLHQLYALPAPIRTFPLPSFYPSNPLSLVHVVYAWLSQTVFSKPPNEPSTTHRGAWSPETRSVHITDPASIRALWEQGFFGKGHLSRSEPNWLKREKDRRGLGAGKVAEQLTSKRREERQRAKWERARIEQEAIERTRLEETRAGAHANDGKTPPNFAVLPSLMVRVTAPVMSKPTSTITSPVGPLDLLRLPNSAADLLSAHALNCSAHGVALDAMVGGNINDTTHLADGNYGANGSASAAVTKADTPPTSLKTQKNVRFSPDVKSATFELHDPPSPINSLSQSTTDLLIKLPSEPLDTPVVALDTPQPEEIADREHLQLSAQEAFFLVFAIGALAVVDPKTESTLSTVELLHLFGDHSFFPPRTSSLDSPGFRTDDPFLVHYVVYHHFRSLGWVPREGVKFGVDWLLYRRGPVFDHAEFGLLVIPSYSNPAWTGLERKAPQRQPSWHWLHGVQRVLSHVLKSMVLVYVDIPPPSAIGSVSDVESGISGLLKQYRVREVMVRRWSSNRNR
ncbi:hypothetical protein RB601_005020 [Gaeumannomyces tritici]